MAIRSSDWLDLMDREYLRRFVPGSGSAIKFVMADDEQLIEIRERLESLAREAGLHVAVIDAAATKIHMIHDVFFAVSRSIDWERLAQTWIEEAFRRNRYSWPRPGESVPLREIAEANDVDELLLRREMQQWLAREIMREKSLVQDFRSAMANLCLRRMELGDERATAPVVEWRGTPYDWRCPPGADQRQDHAPQRPNYAAVALPLAAHLRNAGYSRHAGHPTAWPRPGGAS